MTASYQKVKLNNAGLLAKKFINSKLTLLLILTTLLFGALALVFTPRTYNPEIIVPVVNVAVSRPGSHADEMLNQIVRPLEGLMASIPGVEHTYGMAVNDNAMVTVRFKVGEAEEQSLVKVYNQINSNINRMPPGTMMPLIQSVSLYDIPLLTIALHSNKVEPLVLRDVATKVLEQLRTVKQVGKSSIIGGSAKALRVWLDPKKLQQRNLSINSIERALSINNISLDAGSIEQSLKKLPLRVQGDLISIEDVGNIIVGTDDAKPILLRDIADIKVGMENEDVQSFFTEQTDLAIEPSVTIALARQKGSNGVSVAKDILNKLQALKNSKLLPENIEVTVTRNYGDDADDAVNTLVEHLGVAIFAVVILLLMFLGWREASIVIFSIPLILCLVLGIGWLSGQTINRITLFALILSLGLLVDDSIVVIENIHRHIHKGLQKNFARLVIFASNEIGRPTIIATFTVILALLPMGFVSGMMGPFMAPIPFNAPLAMLVSLLIAYTVVPYLAFRWLRVKAKASFKEASEAHESDERQTCLQRIYVCLFQALIQSKTKRFWFYGFIIFALFAVMLQPMWQFIRSSGPNGPLSFFGVELKMLPDDNVNTLLLEIDAGSNALISETRDIASSIAKALKSNPDIVNQSLFIGASAPEDFSAMARGDALKTGTQFGQIRINLTNKHLREVGSHQIAQKIWQSLEPIRTAYPKAHIKLFESPPGPPVRSQMEAGLYGPNYAELRKLGDELSQQIYPSVYGMINIDNSVTTSTEEVRIEIDHNKAIRAGLIPQEVANAISGYFKGMYVGSIHDQLAREPEHIVVKLQDEARKDVDVLNKLYLKNHQASLIPLANIATIERNYKQKPIFTLDQNPIVYVTGEMLQSSPAYGVMTISKAAKNLPAAIEVDNLGFTEQKPDNTQKNQLFWYGEMRLTLDVFRDLGSAFIVAIVLIYILLAGFYQSFMTPLIIMGAIPLTIIGVFPGHWLLNQPFTATSMIGVIALAGIVVRNSLLLIDFILEHQKAGYDVEQAVIDAGRERLLPIVLTALAIILGSFVMLSDPVFGGLAISLIFGAFASTVLTLFLIPLIYLAVWQKRL